MTKPLNRKDQIKTGLRILMVFSFPLLIGGIIIFSETDSLVPLFITATIAYLTGFVHKQLNLDTTPAPVVAQPRSHQPGQWRRRAIGIRNSSDAEYRESQLARRDRWVIHRWHDGEGDTTYVPAPLWDDEAELTRHAFDTLEQAQDHIRVVGGQFAD